MITPRFSIGQTVFGASLGDGNYRFPCPDCLQTGYWKVTTAAGHEYSITCPRCRGSHTLSQSRVEPRVREILIAGISTDSDNEGLSEVRYKERIGECSSHLWNESVCHSDRESALKAAEEMAVEQNRKLDEERPKRVYERTIYTHQLHDAQVLQAHQRAATAESRLEELLTTICELGTVIRRDEQFFTLTEEHRDMIQDELMSHNPDHKAFLEDWREPE